MGLIDAVSFLLEAGKVKIYSVDSLAGKAWMDRGDPVHATWLQSAFSSVIRWEVVPAIRSDVSDANAEIVAAGASIGAFNAVATICRYPDVVKAAVGMSGTYDLSPWLAGTWNEDFYFSSPLHYLPGLADSWQLNSLRSRFIVLATGTGQYETPQASWDMAATLGAKSIPNRVDEWDGREHDWPTWRAMLPVYLSELA